MNVSTAISGKGNGKDAARRNVIIFFRRKNRNQKLCRGNHLCGNQAEPGTVRNVHMENILHALVIVSKRLCRR